MRLINAETLTIEEFADNKAPKYAILSHTWSLEELSFQEYCTLSDSLKAKAGYQKVQNCCIQSLRDGLKYCWVDTCCIDKTSSAELSEAINSMFRWYRDSEICYAYLADVEVGVESIDDAIKKSNWFTRGWTLQELIAPARVNFYDKDWLAIGSKENLTKLIGSITGIDSYTLRGVTSVYLASVARRMSWAAKRQTTRIEDIAYCLLGIFDINMPLLYGEGEKAFLRLQEEIIKESDDQTIFAWSYSSEPSVSAPALSMLDYGILAKQPSMFQDCGAVESISEGGGPYNITNRGLRIQLPIFQHPKIGKMAILACYFAHSRTISLPPMLSRIAIPISETHSGDGSFGRQRYACPLILEESEVKLANIHTIYLCKHDTETFGTNVERMNQLFIKINDSKTILLEAVWAPKPITDLTAYCSWTKSSHAADAHSSNARSSHIMDIDFRRGKQDHIAVFHFKHIGVYRTSFMVLLETKHAREFLVMRVIPYANDVILKAVIQNSVAPFEKEQTTALWLTGLFAREATCSLNKNITLKISFHKRGIGTRNGVRFDGLHLGVSVMVHMDDLSSRRLSQGTLFTAISPGRNFSRLSRALFGTANPNGEYSAFESF